MHLQTPAFKNDTKKKRKRNYLKMGKNLPSTIVKLLGAKNDSPNPLKYGAPRLPSAPVRISWSKKCVSVALLKELAYRTNCSVNDVILAGMSVSFSNYMHKEMEKSSADPSWTKCIQQIQAGVWVSMVPLKLKNQKITWGNHLGAVMINLPIQKKQSSLEKLKNINYQTQELLNSPEPLISSFVMKVVGLLPGPLCRFIWDTSSAYTSSVSISTIPGPNWEMLFCEKKVNRIGFLMTPQKKYCHFYHYIFFL